MISQIVKQSQNWVNSIARVQRLGFAIEASFFALITESVFTLSNYQGLDFTCCKDNVHHGSSITLVHFFHFFNCYRPSFSVDYK